MLNKEIILVTGNSCWWKEKKFRRESAIFLNKQRVQGWRLKQKLFVEKKINSVDTRIFHKYILVKS